ncbi:MAG: orotidine 5-phosphate decarboxylase [Rhodospirillales bacterium]|nr:orotidine 5-phosphate decarboxylase [Rhodospirillales bacterium]
MTSSFAARLQALAAARSPLCVGIDPSTELLQQWGLPVSASGVGRFCATVMEAAGDRVAIVKPQAAFFERFGPEGMRELQVVVGLIRAHGALSLIDCKRNDIGHTLAAYGEAMLGPDSAFGGDAMTVSAYFGFGALAPVLARAVATGCGIFVVVRSSNPEGAALQDARLADGRTIADALADDVTAFNATVGEAIGPVGAVMGATAEGEAAATLARLTRSFLLAPGIGAQGATFESMAASFGAAAQRALPAISRGILAKGPSVTALREAIERAREGAFRVFEG